MASYKIGRACVVTGLLALVFLTTASAHAASPPWTKAGLIRAPQGAYTTNTCGTEGRHVVDPINVVWYGRGAIADRVAHKLWQLDWNHDDRNSPYGQGGLQFVRQRQIGCTASNAPRATSCAICERDHVRLFQTLIIHSSGDSVTSKRFVVGDAHHDHLSYLGGCSSGLGLAGHVARFNQGRNSLLSAWGDISGAGARFWGNTRRIRQCDGHANASDGYVIYLKMGGASTATVDRHPLNVDLPQITGSFQVGSVLTATPGTWSSSATNFTYRWCVVSTTDGDVCDPIPGATASTWTPTASYLGRTVAVRVRPVDVNQESSVLSNAGIVTADVAVSPPDILVGAFDANGMPNLQIRPNGATTDVQWFARCDSPATIPPGNCIGGNQISVPPTPAVADIGVFGPGNWCGPGSYWVKATNSAGSTWVGPYTDPIYCV